MCSAGRVEQACYTHMCVCLFVWIGVVTSDAFLHMRAGMFDQHVCSCACAGVLQDRTAAYRCYSNVCLQLMMMLAHITPPHREGWPQPCLLGSRALTPGCALIMWCLMHHHHVLWIEHNGINSDRWLGVFLEVSFHDLPRSHPSWVWHVTRRHGLLNCNSVRQLASSQLSVMHLFVIH